MKEKMRTARLIYKIAFSLLTAALALLFIAQVLSIYHLDAAQRFTRAIVQEKLLQLLPFCIVWLVGVIVGVVLWNIHPDEDQKPHAERNKKTTLKALQSRLPNSLDEQSQVWLKQAKVWGVYPLIAWLAYALVCLAGVIVCVVYLTNPAHFADQNNINGEVINAVLFVLPWVIGAFVCALGVFAFENYALDKRLDLVKKAVAANSKNLQKPQEQSAALSENKKLLTGLRIGLLAVGVALFVIGIFNGGLNDVLIKAINICTECIGLG